jgi:hypothetical protein
MKELSFEKMEKLNGGRRGQATMNCIEHAYTKNGWISVWAWVQTAYIPITGVAIAGACILNNL